MNVRVCFRHIHKRRVGYFSRGIYKQIAVQKRRKLAIILFLFSFFLD